MRHHLTYHHACTSRCSTCNSSLSCGAQKSFCLVCFPFFVFKRRSHGRQQEPERKYVAQDHLALKPLSWQNIWPLRADVNSVQVSCQVWLARFGGRATPSSRPWETPENGTCQTDRCKCVSLTLPYDLVHSGMPLFVLMAIQCKCSWFSVQLLGCVNDP